MAAEAHPIATGGRSSLERPLRARLPDRLMRWILTALAAGILILIAYFFVRLISEARPALDKFGVFAFTFDNNWDVSRSIYGALPLVVGTLITSAIALLIGVPVAVAAAVYLTELCPRRARQPLTILLELLAAVPSVVYGLWGVFVLIPKLKPAEAWFGRTFDWVPFVGPDVAGPNYFIAGLILAIMILPIVSAISREVIATVLDAQKEAALALGATRWEMIRMAVLPYSTRYSATPIPIGMAISAANATISTVPSSADLMPPGSPMKAPVGSVEKKCQLIAPSPRLSR